MKLLRSLLIYVFAFQSLYSMSQIILSGKVENEKGEALSFVNIGIKGKNIGACASEDGLFTITIPQNLEKDSLSFALLGYEEFNIAIPNLITAHHNKIALKSKTIYLKDIPITAQKLVEKKIGISKYKPAFHIIDASIQQKDIFEIAQVLRLPKSACKITSLNIFINESRKDSGVFRINFYELSDDKPYKKLNSSDIVFTKPINEGWLSFDLKDKNIYLKGDVVASIEFISSGQGSIKYEVKVGGTSKSFVRTSSFGKWNVPPHHYRLYATALVSDEKSDSKNDDEDHESAPKTILYSTNVRDSMYIFVSLPKNYNKESKTRYPTVYLLDANVYFDFLKDNTENIIVGIGYKNAYFADSLREKDYTYPKANKSDSMKLSGGGMLFLKFIEEELIPFIDGHYLTDSTQRTLMGHSLGGYFTLFALSQNWNHPSRFNNYISASPSLDYAQGYLMEQFKELKEYPTGSKTLFLTAGADEDLKELPLLVNTLKNTSVKVKSVVFPKMGHMETAVSTFKVALFNGKVKP
jgi:predicted alpha/beta superfamily hydrolase